MKNGGPINMRIAVLLTVTIVAAGIAVWFLWLRDDTQRLMDIGAIGGSNAGLLTGDKFYWARRGELVDQQVRKGQKPQEQDSALMACTLSGERQAAVASEPPSRRFDSVPVSSDSRESRLSAVYRDQAIFYVTRPRPTAGVISAGDIQPIYAIPLGTCMPREAPARGAAAARHVRFASATIRAVPASGGAPRDVKLLDAAGEVALFPARALWLRHVVDSTEVATVAIMGPLPPDAVRIEYGPLDYKLTIRGHCDLMLTTLPGGVTRRVAASLPQDSRFDVRDDGVFWTNAKRASKRLARLEKGGSVQGSAGRPSPRSAPSSDAPADLYYASAATGKVAPLGAAAGPSVGPAAEYRGRLYWFASRTAVLGNPLARVLMSARLDGSDLRTVLALKDRRPSMYAEARMAARPDGLYVVMQSPDSNRGDLQSLTTSLCRIHPEPPAALDEVRRLPHGSYCGFEGCYVYFAVGERTRGLWEKLTDDHAGPKPVVRLCRVPIR